MKASQRISELIDQYLREHPDFKPLKEEYTHPSVLALHNEIKPWLIAEFGDSVKFWSVILDAAKEWFPDVNNTKLGHIFCVRFEIEECTWWNGWVPIQPVVKDYLEWRGLLKNK